MSTVKDIEKRIEQLCAELDQVYNSINTFVGSGPCHAHILSKLFDQRNALVGKKAKLEQQLVELGGKPKPNHLD